jgi:upstream-binding transcription factor
MSITLEILTQRVEALEKQLALLLENKNEQVVEKKPKKSKKIKDDSSDDEKPKTKRVSGYILFSNATRDEVRDSLSKDEDKPKNTDIMKELARLWKELSDEDKEPWNAKAKELKNAA